MRRPALEKGWTTFTTWWNGWNARFNVVNGTFWKGIGKTIVDAIEGAISYLKTCIENFLKWFGLTVPKGIADPLTEGIKPVRLFEQACKDVEVAFNGVIGLSVVLLALAGGPAKKLTELLDLSHGHRQARVAAPANDNVPLSIPGITEVGQGFNTGNLMAGAYGMTTVSPDTTSPEFRQQYGMQRGGVLNPSGIYGRQGRALHQSVRWYDCPSEIGHEIFYVRWLHASASGGFGGEPDR